MVGKTTGSGVLGCVGYSMQRLEAAFIVVLLLSSCQSALASDWVDDDMGMSRARASGNPENSVSATPFESGATPGTVQSSGLHLHFLQAIEALELEIFAKGNSRSSINERLDLLEKAVYGSAVLEELSDNMQRLHRLLSVVPLSDASVVAAAGKSTPGAMDGGDGSSTMTQQNAGGTRSGFWRSALGMPRDTASGVGKVLRSPAFWTLVGVGGALVCGYLLARRYSGGYYSNSCVSGVNPNDHFVEGYFDRNGVWHRPHMQTNPNGTMTDNFSAICNVNPYTGQLGYVPSWR